MPAHVVYPKVDPRPAGFSAVWLKRCCASGSRFDGVIFSDDLEHGGRGGRRRRGGARATLRCDAGCDMVLVCNNPEAADELLAELRWEPSPVPLARLARMHGRGPARTPCSCAKTRTTRARCTTSARIAVGSRRARTDRRLRAERWSSTGIATVHRPR